MKCKLDACRANALSTSHSGGKEGEGEKSLPPGQQTNSQRKNSLIRRLMMPSYQRNFLKLDNKLTALSQKDGGEVYEFLIRELHIAYQKLEPRVQEDCNALKDLNSIFKSIRGGLRILNGIRKCLSVDEDTGDKNTLRDKYESWRVGVTQKSMNSNEVAPCSDVKPNDFKNFVSDELRDAYLIYERHILLEKLGMARI